MKYRIIRKTDNIGYYYEIQKQWFWLFWIREFDLNVRINNYERAGFLLKEIIEEKRAHQKRKLDANKVMAEFEV